MVGALHVYLAVFTLSLYMGSVIKSGLMSLKRENAIIGFRKLPPFM